MVEKRTCVWIQSQWFSEQYLRLKTPLKPCPQIIKPLLLSLILRIFWSILGRDHNSVQTNFTNKLRPIVDSLHIIGQSSSKPRPLYLRLNVNEGGWGKSSVLCLNCLRYQAPPHCPLRKCDWPTHKKAPPPRTFKLQVISGCREKLNRSSGCSAGVGGANLGS